MRLCVLAVFVAASLVAATTPKINGCPAYTAANMLYGNTSSDCAQNTACTTAYTTCLGATPNCTVATACIHARFVCLNAAADNVTGCKQLNNVHLSHLQVAAGQLFNASGAYMSCVATACHWLNATDSGKGTNCTIDNAALCTSPVVFVATVLMRGNFTAILNDPVKRANFAAAIARDLSRVLRIIGIRVTRMFLSGSKRQADQVLVVEVEVPGVSAKNADFKAAFDTFAANPSAFLTEAGSVYKAETGQSLTVLKVGAGSSSAAFSSIPAPGTSAPAATSTPATPRPPTPASNNTNAPATSAPSGVLAQSVLAVAVAVLAAMLF